MQMQPLIGIVDLGGGLFRRYMKSKYLHALRASGAEPRLLPLIQTAEEAEEQLGACAGLLLPGGADIDPRLYGEQPHELCGAPHPGRDIAEPLYLAQAIRRQMPVLGICRGCQLVNVALGGSLWQDIGEMEGAHGRHRDFPKRARFIHTVQAQPGSRVAALCGERFGVNSMHHQALRRIAPGLSCTATAEDGVPEAVEGAQTPFFLAVQWHPEHLFRRDERSRRLFAAFTEAAAAFAAAGE